MLGRSLEAADTLAQQSINAEVIDLRTLNPLDTHTLAQSVSRTGRAVIVTEDTLTGGVGAEIAARLQSEAFDFLEAPIARVSGEDIPIPVSPDLETASVPTVASIVKATQIVVGKP
jgi:pyruvate dehydrogenase E1 component beta subunit